MAAAAASDIPELESWYRHQVLVHEEELRAYLRRAFPIVTDPDDVVQETFARVLQARRQGDVANPRAYVFTTARNLALALMRRDGVATIAPMAEVEELGVSAEADVPEQVALRFDLEALAAALAALPERCRLVLTLRKIEGLSQREVAKRLGISEHTVEVQVANGMRRCAQFFRQRGLMPERKEAR